MRSGRLGFQKLVLLAEVMVLALGILVVTTNHDGLDMSAFYQWTGEILAEGPAALLAWAGEAWDWLQAALSDAGTEGNAQ